jgi:HSP20 family protein
MATRNEGTEVNQQGQQRAQENKSGRQGSARQSETRGDRQRELQTGREGRSQTSMVRPERSGAVYPASGSARSPFALMRRVMEDMDRMFDDFGLSRDFGFGRGFMSPFAGGSSPDLWTGLSGGSAALWSPAVEVIERGDNIVVRAELPGLSKDDVNIDINGDVLTIEGERQQESENQGEGFYRSERSYGRFLRSIPLPDGVDTEKAEATFKDGVLEVTLPAPKREANRGRKISIR